MSVYEHLCREVSISLVEEGSKKETDQEKLYLLVPIKEKIWMSVNECRMDVFSYLVLQCRIFALCAH